MKALDRELVPTRSMRLELANERRFVGEGRDFLDQKRVLLASEILRRLPHYEALAARLDDVMNAARRALGCAVARHGVSELRALAAPAPGPRVVVVAREVFVGSTLVELGSRHEVIEPGHTPVNPSPEARAAAARFAEAARLAVELAGERANLSTLLGDYRRTERRARALEDVILPEIDAALTAIDEHLDAEELEEAVRVRIRPP